MHQSQPLFERFGLGPSQRLDWLKDESVRLRVVSPIDLSYLRGFAVL